MELKQKGLALPSESSEEAPDPKQGWTSDKTSPVALLPILLRLPEGPWMCSGLLGWLCSDFSCVCAWCSACDVCISPGPEARETMGKGACKSMWPFNSGEKGVTTCMNTPMRYKSSPRFGGQGHQAVNWCEDAFEGVDGGGSTASTAWFLDPSPPSCPDRRLVSPSHVQKAAYLANSGADSIESPGPWRESPVQTRMPWL